MAAISLREHVSSTFWTMEIVRKETGEFIYATVDLQEAFFHERYLIPTLSISGDTINVGLWSQSGLTQEDLAFLQGNLAKALVAKNVFESALKTAKEKK